MALRDIVNVQIDRNTRSVSRPGFGIVMVLGSHHRFTEKTRSYSSIDAVADDFDVTDPEYVAANAVFSQNPSPVSILIGRRASDVANLVVVTATSNREYIVTVNGIEYSFTSDASATKDEIVAGLVAAINAGSVPVTASAGTVGTGKLIITADVTGTPFSVVNGAIGAFDTSLTVDYTSETNLLSVAADLTAIKEINNTWYALVLTSRTVSDIVDMSGETGAANWVEANTKVFITASAATDIINVAAGSDSTTVAALVKAKGYDRTQVFYHESAATLFPEAAVFGKILPQTPGSYTEKFKTLAGVVVSTLTGTQETNGAAKNVLLYQEVGSVPITSEGKVASGEFLDTIIFIDWLQTEIQYNVFTLLASMLKLPFTSGGISAVGGQVRAALQKGQDNGGISPFEFDSQKMQIGGYVVTLPALASISTADKAARFLDNVKFTAWLAGAIHSTKINGTVTL